LQLIGRFPEATPAPLRGGEIQAHTPRSEDITITDNAIILKERVVDHAHDPLGRLIRVLTGTA
jgi:hypothetical protein